MSLAEKCDICGQFTEPYIRNVRTPNKLTNIREINFNEYNLIDGERFNNRYYKICQDCQNAFMEFVENRKTEQPKEEFKDEDLYKYML